jgi:YVTN family beta-propeller protein
VINVVTNTIETNIFDTLFNAPFGISINTDNNLAYVTNSGSDEIFIINCSNNLLLPTIITLNPASSPRSIIYNQNDLLVNGQLQFHGVTKQISFNAKQSDKEGNIFFEGAFPILLEDFKVQRPSLLFVKADNEIQIKFKLYFK